MERAVVGLIFLRRKIENQKAVDAGVARFAMKTFESELEDRIQVGVEDDRDLGARPDLADAIEDARNSGARFQGALGRQLIDEAVGERIGKWNSELEDVGAGFFQRESEIDGTGEIGIAGADVDDECFLISGSERFETLIDSILNGSGLPSDRPRAETSNVQRPTSNVQ